MTTASGTRIVALEEHYWDRELAGRFEGAEGQRGGDIEDKLFDLGSKRLADMDAAGIDYSIISHGPPSAQKIADESVVALCARVNDRLLNVVGERPTRFGAFCALPTAFPDAAADELERCVAAGAAGAMIHGLTNGRFIDGKEFWPIFARAEQLNVPIYLHPSWPAKVVSDLYYKDYLSDFPMLARAAWGYSVENGTTAVRIILSGLLEQHPDLKLILGHLGETIPFQLSRLDEAFNRPGSKRVAVRDMVRRNFWITTSGFFSTHALRCCIEEMGSDRVLFSIDYPFVSESAPGTAWLVGADITDDERAQIFSGNAEAILKTGPSAGNG